MIVVPSMFEGAANCRLFLLYRTILVEVSAANSDGAGGSSVGVVACVIVVPFAPNVKLIVLRACAVPVDNADYEDNKGKGGQVPVATHGAS